MMTFLWRSGIRPWYLNVLQRRHLKLSLQRRRLVEHGHVRRESIHSRILRRSHQLSRLELSLGRGMTNVGLRRVRRAAHKELCYTIRGKSKEVRRLLKPWWVLSQMRGVIGKEDWRRHLLLDRIHVHTVILLYGRLCLFTGSMGIRSWNLWIWSKYNCWTIHL